MSMAKKKTSKQSKSTKPTRDQPIRGAKSKRSGMILDSDSSE